MSNTAPFYNAQWIAPSLPSASPIIRRSFTLEDVTGGLLHITGLGYFEARLNGVRLGDEWFQPVASDYEKRPFTVVGYPVFDTFTHRIYYRTFDVAALLHPGENTLEIQLGGGWYLQKERVCEGEMFYGDSCKCIYALTAGGSTVVSDGSESWSDSEIVYSQLFIGEIHDPTAPPCGGPVVCLPAPDTILTPQIGQPDRHIRTIKPRLLHQRGGRKIYDAGENISGVVRVRTKPGSVGRVTLRFAEVLGADGELDFLSTGGDYICASGRPQIMQDEFVCDGTARSFTPKFVWHAFRYFDVEGDADDFEVLVIHTDAPLTAKFSSDSEGLNFLFDAFLRTQWNNMHGSYPSDCPHRERLGYTGDGQCAAPAVMMLLDSRSFYRKWIRDILDCQDLTTGHIQHTTPFQGGGGGPGGWGCAVVLVPYYYLKQWGPDDLLAECYQPMKRWIGYLQSRSENNLVVRETPGGWCLGDWCTLEPIRLPEPFVNTYYLVRCLDLLCEIAALLGHSEDIPAFQAQKEACLQAIRQTYYNAETGHYCDGTQGADAYAAALGLLPAAVCADYYDRLGHYDTGFLATDLLTDLLFRQGYGDVASKLLTTEELGGFLHMKRQGATTIWEYWDDRSSHDHPMFGACVRQLFCGILGLRQADDSYGWQRVELCPYLPDGVQHASGSILTPCGEIAVSLQRNSDTITTAVTVPPQMQVTWHGKTLAPGNHTLTLS